MEVINTQLPGVAILLPQVFQDRRGWFYESYNKQAFEALGLDMEFIQDNHSLSIPRYTLRGSTSKTIQQRSPSWCGAFADGFWTTPWICGRARTPI